MQNGASCTKDSNNFMNKFKNVDIPNDALLVTADAVGLYFSIPHEVGLKALRNALENKNYKEILTENLVKMEKHYYQIQLLSTNFGYCYRDYICSTVCVYFYGSTQN